MEVNLELLTVDTRTHSADSNTDDGKFLNGEFGQDATATGGISQEEAMEEEGEIDSAFVAIGDQFN